MSNAENRFPEKHRASGSRRLSELLDVMARRDHRTRSEYVRVRSCYPSFVHTTAMHEVVMSVSAGTKFRRAGLLPRPWIKSISLEGSPTGIRSLFLDRMRRFSLLLTLEKGCGRVGALQPRSTSKSSAILDIVFDGVP
jgi:hypothetical protein